MSGTHRRTGQDIVTVCMLAAGLLILIGAGAASAAPPPCPADTNGDGVIDAADLGALLGGWGPNPGHPADINADGVIDAFDLGQLLGTWGACPQCATAADCDDGAECTEDLCASGLCVHTPIEPCCGNGITEPPEICDPPDGVSCGVNCLPLDPCPGEGDCCVPHGTPGCEDEGCCNVVCGEDVFCCEVFWDSLCSDFAQDLCSDLCVGGPSNCCFAHGSPGCDDVQCQDLVCAIDIFCCNIGWDQLCADMASAPDGCVICQP